MVKVYFRVRYVIVGTHRDAWASGAVDPSSALAAVMAAAESMARAATDGRWRPRRSVAFVAWGAEEMGLIGSTEWVEEKLPKLRSRAVAYINSDMCVSGADLAATASGPLKEIIVDALKDIKDPDDWERSMYDKWKEGGGRGGIGSGPFYQVWI